MRQFLKKCLIPFMLAALILLGGCSDQSAESQSESNQPQPEKTLYTHGMEVISLLQEMAKSEKYIDLLSGSGDIKSVLLEAGQGNYSQPKAVYRIKISETAVLSLMEIDLDGLSDTLQENLKSRIASIIFTQINAMGGSQTLAASSLCTAGKTFVSSELEENEIYLYTYENAVPAAVTFTKGEDGTVSATGTFVLYEAFQEDPAASVTNLLGEFGVVVEPVA